ncbi:hypothetical protein GCM10010377_73920 [Streptomyces viridiviolaceus]|nr:hypothetical protein GCM10010377_73920 [Streptomyces viridiviolaceus]
MAVVRDPDGAWDERTAVPGSPVGQHTPDFLTAVEELRGMRNLYHVDETAEVASSRPGRTWVRPWPAACAGTGHGHATGPSTTAAAPPAASAPPEPRRPWS